MKLASYKGTQAGWRGMANRLIRFRLNGEYSHSEVVFLPGEGIDHLMPDGTCLPINGSYWCASAVAAERMPVWSTRRADRIGGVRFKRIVLDPAKWDLDDYPGDPVVAAGWFVDNQGAPYDWQLIFGFLAWFIPNKSSRYMCSESVAAAGQYPDAHRFDPCVLYAANLNHLLRSRTSNG